MLKQISNSDISLRPFKVYKAFEATNFDSGSGYEVYHAVNHTGSTDVLSDSEAFENGLYHQIKTMYYNGENSLNPFISYGTFKPRYTNVETAKQRKLTNRAVVLTIPQIKFGEEIKPTTIELYNGELNENIVDDGYGNLFSNYSSYTFTLLDIENRKFIFYDAENTLITTTLLYLDVENNTMLVQNENEFYLLTIDVEAGTISFLGIFVSTDLVVPVIGNVIYSHGLIILTKETEIGQVRANSLANFNLKYNSTNTIYENEYLIIVGEDEFNVSTNPSAVEYVNLVSSSIQTTYDGIKKVTSYDAATIKSEFNQYEYSSSVDPTGSYLTPYITTIGLYDENMDMVAVAKMATPIKSMPDLPVNFLVRIDT